MSELPGPAMVLETERLLLRPWRAGEAGIQRGLWTERDARVPPHRRIDAAGRPTVEDLEQRIRIHQPSSSIGLLAAQRKLTHDVIGYCGLIDSERGAGGVELAFEFFQRVWNQGYATEAAIAVVGWAKSAGHQRIWATVREWNHPSRRVLAKVGFIDSGRIEVDSRYGNTLYMVKRM